MTTLAATTTPPSGSEDGLIGADPMASPERPGSCLAARHGQAVCTDHDIQRLCDLPADAREQLRALGLYPAVAQLCESERQFRDLFDRGPVASHEVDLNGVVRRVNRAECDLLGVEAGAMLDRPIFEFIAPEEQSQSREALKKKLSGQQAVAPFLREYVRSDGRHLTLEIHELLIKAGPETPGHPATGDRQDDRNSHLRCLAGLTRRTLRRILRRDHIEKEERFSPAHSTPFGENCGTRTGCRRGYMK
jgi:PAS domain S-box-containing protein